MSKIILASDWHLGIYPLNYLKWFNNSKKYFTEFYIPLLKKAVKPGDIMVHCGDVFDNRTQIPFDVLNYAQELFEEIASIVPVHILVGNHDCFQKDFTNINSPKLFKHIKDLYVYEKTTPIDFDGKKLLMMPWVEHRRDQVKLLHQHSGCDYLFCHSDLAGARMHLKSVAHKNRDKIGVEEFGGYGQVYSGHIHIVQENENFTFIGSNMEYDRNDMGNQKGVFLLNASTGDRKFVPNEISPRFKRLEIAKEEHIELLTDVDTSKDYIDLAISQTLIVGSRKLRNKLEKILETGSFASVEYINDIVKDSDKINEQLSKELNNDVKIDVNTFDGLNKMVMGYTKGQEYANEKVKTGVEVEMENILTLYKDSYKFKTTE